MQRGAVDAGRWPAKPGREEYATLQDKVVSVWRVSETKQESFERIQPQIPGGRAASLVSFVAAVMLGSTSTPAQVLFNGIAALPISIGVGILKYRLYDIDRIISRTLAYAIVTGLPVGVYAGLVLLTTQVFRVHTPVAVAAATLAAAALFNPVRRRVQQAVDRRFNRARYDADQTIAAFAARLKDAVDLNSVRDDLTGVVHQVLEPTQVSVWISQRD